MARDIVQRLLDDAVDVNRRGASEREWVTGFFIGYGNARLSFYGGEIPGESGFEPGFVEHHGVERLRKAAHRVERVLSNFPYLAKVRAQRRIFGSVFFCAPEHGANRGQNLAELVMQFARDITQSRLLRCDELLRQVAALLR